MSKKKRKEFHRFIRLFDEEGNLKEGIDFHDAEFLDTFFYPFEGKQYQEQEGDFYDEAKDFLRWAIQKDGMKGLHPDSTLVYLYYVRMFNPCHCNMTDKEKFFNPSP